MNNTVRALVIVSLVVAAIGVHMFRSMVAPGDPDPIRIAAVQRRLDALPMTLADGKYTGVRQNHEQELVVKSGADSHAAAAFATENHALQFNIYIGGSTNPDLAFHAPSVCLPAAGWELADDRLVEFEAFAADSPDSQMRRLHVRFGNDERLCYFWFQSGTDIAPSIWKARFFNFRERLGGERNSPTYIVVVYAPIRESVRHTDQAARLFMKALGPQILSAVAEDHDG